MSINKFKISKENNELFNSKPYKGLSKIMVATFISFMLLQVFRDDLYKLNNPYITLFAGTAPNLISSFLFTLIIIFYILPLFKSIDLFNNNTFIWLINIINIIFFALIEYIHLVLNLGFWDNNDIIASLIGIIFSTAIYFKLRKNILEIYDK